MQLRSLVLAALAATCAFPAHAIHVNQHVFVANGGNLQNVAGTAPNVFDQLRVASFTAPFGTVGDLGGCTGTWLGMDATHGWILTAAHCVPSTTLMRPVGHLSFRDAHARVLAGGAGGLAFVHPNRFNAPTGVSEAGTDIALLRLPLVPPTTSANAPAAPWLHDNAVTVGATIALIGTGTAGVANTPVDAWWPASGQRRAWGETRFDSTREHGYVAVAGFSPTQGATHWARAGAGDGGAAWWQKQSNEWSIVATTNGGHATATIGAMVAPYARWINDLFPAAKRNSERLRVTRSQAFQSHNYALDAAPGEVGYVVAANQPGVVGPTKLRVSVSRRHTTLTVPVRDAFGNARDLKLRAHRLAGRCGAVEMENPNWCNGQRHSALKIWYDPADNTHLWNHRWQGELAIDALGWGGPSFHRRIELEIDIDLAEFKGRITRTAGYDSGNILEGKQVRSNNVYHTVPPQPGAVGPTASTSNHTTGYYGHSTIVAHARSALTQEIVPIKLRAQRHVQCFDWGQMNYFRECGLWYAPYARMRVWFDPADNPGLPGDRYLGEFFIQSHGQHGGNLIRIELEIDSLF